jgi:glyoxylase I family protein
MANQLALGGIHHVRLTVTDVERSRAFYTEVLGFQIAADEPPPVDDPYHNLVVENLQGGIVLTNAGILIGLRPVDAANAGDAFNPFRCGLDHLSFSVNSREDLDAAVRLFDERGITHGEIVDLVPFGISVLPFRDPDGVQLELSAPSSG